MNERVCLDAGVVVKLFIPEEGQDRALALLERIHEIIQNVSIAEDNLHGVGFHSCNLIRDTYQNGFIGYVIRV